MEEINIIPIVFISDTNFVMQTAVAITSLMENKAQQTDYDIYVIAAGCTVKDFGLLAQMPHVKIVEVPMQDFQDINQVAHISIAALLKFSLCDLLYQHNKILYIDGDVIVREDLSALFNIDIGENFMGAVYTRFDEGDSQKKINSGVLLYNAKKMREESMSQHLLAYRKSLGDKGSMDQQTFNSVLNDKMFSIPARYNCTLPVFYDDLARYGFKHLNEVLETEYNSFEGLLADAAIIHYNTGLKPWKYKHAPLGDEWYSYYLRSPYSSMKLSRKNKFQQRIEIAISEVRQGGVIALVVRIFSAIKRRLKGKKADVSWG